MVHEGRCVRDFFELVYFGVVTGSTLGYGDLEPVGKARILACLQVMEFWMFLGIAILYLQSAVDALRQERQIKTPKGWPRDH